MSPGEISAAFLAEARSWLGTPYRHQGRRKGVGCDQCHNTGFSGRNSVAEMLKVDQVFRDAVMQKLATRNLQQVAIQQGMQQERQCKRDSRGCVAVRGIDISRRPNLQRSPIQPSSIDATVEAEDGGRKR